MNSLIIVGIIILVIILLAYFSFANEHMQIFTHIPGFYKLTPMFSPSIKANNAISLRVIPDRSVNPNYLTFIIHYKNGNSYVVQTNASVEMIYTKYNDINNVLYRIPQNIQYELDLANGIFKALTVVYSKENDTKLQLMPYQISGRIPL